MFLSYLPTYVSLSVTSRKTKDGNIRQTLKDLKHILEKWKNVLQ